MPLSQSSPPPPVGGRRNVLTDIEDKTEVDDDDAHPLLSELVNGDLAAFWKLWEQHRKYLYGVCLRQMGGIHADAEDALSRAMMTAWRRLPNHAGKIHDQRSLRGWLARLTHNLCVDIHRERKRNGGPLRSLDEFTPENVEAAGGSAESPEDSLLRREMELYLRLMIARLAPNLRTPFVLRFFHDIPYGEIAAQLNLSSENVRKRIQQARAVLQDNLRQYRAGLTVPTLRFGEFECLEELLAGLFAGDELCVDEAPRARTSRPRTVRTACVVLPSGVERSFDILLDKSWAADEVGALARSRDYPEGREHQLSPASLLHESGRWEEAVGELRRLIARQPDLTEAQLRLGDILCQLGRGEEAWAVYEQALRAAKKESMRRHLRGLMEVSRGRHERAAVEFRRAALLEPRAPLHLHSLGLTHLRAGSHVEALKAFDEALKRDPDDIVALTFSHDPLMASGCSREAVRRLRRAIKLDAKNAAALTRLVKHRLTLGAVAGVEGQETRRLLHMVERAAPDAPQVRELLATYHVRRGEWEEGVRRLLTLVAERPMCPAGWRSLAHTLLQTGEYDEAADVARRAHALHPDDLDIQEAACEVFARARRPDALRHILAVLLTRRPGRWSVWTTAGLALVSSHGDDAERACSLSSHATTLRPQLADAWFEHGKVLAAAGRHREAVNALTEGWKFLTDEACDPRTLSAAVCLGESCAACGDEERARAWFETAVRRSPAQATLRSAATHFWQGRALEALGDKANAVQCYSEALAAHVLYPERQEALKRLERLTDRAPRV
ncbi:MAG TPA: sigma-70 family RNA polymerase sigma factor [Pyrinomonadaceae bacterium]|nr:sigma-70 family RNA polymerase sigma factor [Pyrinomonadaceae bacterium]